jgi:hypothetical protein
MSIFEKISSELRGNNRSSLAEKVSQLYESQGHWHLHIEERARVCSFFSSLLEMSDEEERHVLFPNNPPDILIEDIQSIVLPTLAKRWGLSDG